VGPATARPRRRTGRDAAAVPSSDAVRGGRTAHLRAAALWGLVCLVAAWPQPAFAQEAAPSPSASELWKTYPLHETPAPATTADATPPPDTPAARTDGPERRTGDDGGGIGLLVALVVVAGAAGLGFLVLRRVRRPAPRPASARGAPSQLDRRRRHNGRLLPARHAAGGTAPSSARNAAGGDIQDPLPPEPDLEWTAEIEWRRTVGRPRFHVIARSSTMGAASIATSPPIRWPPTDETSLEALRDAIAALEATLLEAGWIPTEPGTAWYAKRFAWKPVPVAATSAASPPGAALASSPDASPARPEPSSRSGR